MNKKTDDINEISSVFYYCILCINPLQSPILLFEVVGSLV